MSTPIDTSAYCNAKFLVEFSPEDAINIIWEGSKRGEIKLDEWVDIACTKLGLGGRSVHTIRGMIEDRQWDELKELKQPSTPSARTPRERRMPLSPPTPNSTPSGSLQLQPKSYDWIYVYLFREAPVMLIARPSGSGYYFIGEDKLERFHGVGTEWITPTRKVALGGQWIEVAQIVRLTWNRPPGESGTMCEQFWVVPPGLIREADVLLGDRDQQFVDARNKVTVDSPSFALDPQTPDHRQVPPFVPSPPQQQRFHQPSTISSGLYSVPDGSIHPFDQGSHRDFGIRNNQPPRPTATTESMTSGSRSVYNSASSQSPIITEPPLSRPESVSSTKTVKPPRGNMVTVQISFRRTGKRVSGLDLTKSADGVISYLQPHVQKLGQQLDCENHELTITPIKGTRDDSPSCLLSELDCTWDAMVEFIKDNRDVESKKPEFFLDIG